MSSWNLPSLSGLALKPVFIKKRIKETLPIIAGTRFHKFVTTGLSKKQSSVRQALAYQCKCDCGSLKYVRKDNLVSGLTKSCGCGKGRAVAKLQR